MDRNKAKRVRQLRRQRHVRRGIVGTAERPRLSVFRSNKHIYAQLIDDLNGVTLAAASSLAIKGEVGYGGNIKAAAAVGKALAEAARARGIDKAAFDRGHYKFHGRVKALAEAATANGLKCSESRKPQPPPGEAKKPAKGEKKPAEGKKEKGKKEKAEAGAPA